MMIRILLVLSIGLLTSKHAEEFLEMVTLDTQQLELTRTELNK
jgi:hypothetical protein